MIGIGTIPIKGRKLLYTLRRDDLASLGRALSDATLNERRFLITGPTDAAGSARYDLSLSQRRANAVRNYMLKRFGLGAGRLQSIGYGEERLKRQDQPLGGENRRVQVINVSAFNHSAQARSRPATQATGQGAASSCDGLPCRRMNDRTCGFAAWGFAAWRLADRLRLQR